MRIVIASRKSDLARLQALTIAKMLKEKHQDLEVIHHFSQSFGDQNPEANLWDMPEKGVFTEDFRDGLSCGDFDMVVHSWKDLPTDLPSKSIIHTIKRADARDVLLIKKSSLDKIILNKNISIYTSSPRRTYHLEKSLFELLPGEINKINFEIIRGNIPTRLKKLFENEVDALVMAKAALDRLMTTEIEEFSDLKHEMQKYLDQFHWIVLPLSLFPTAAAQGALAIETLEGNEKINNLLAKIHDEQTYKDVQEERDILKSYGGGCHQKIGINISNYFFGKIKSLLGISPLGEKLHEYKLVQAELKNQSAVNIWPKNKEQAKLFDIQAINVDVPSKEPLWVSHINAVPPGYKQGSDQIIWCAGVMTWKRLAQRGFWVNGCSDGLGEKISQNIEIFTGENSRWCKITHTKGKIDQTEKTLFTYKLISLNKKIDCDQIDEFFWRSGSHFLEALKVEPNIIKKKHFCGPGHTYDVLKGYVAKENLSLVLSYEAWLKKYS